VESADGTSSSLNHGGLRSVSQFVHLIFFFKFISFIIKYIMSKISSIHALSIFPLCFNIHCLRGQWINGCHPLLIRPGTPAPTFAPLPYTAWALFVCCISWLVVWFRMPIPLCPPFRKCIWTGPSNFFVS